MRSLLVAALVAVPCSAQTFRGVDAINVSVSRQAVTSEPNADLRITERHVTATHGVKFENSTQSFFVVAPVSLGVPYLVRDASGTEFRLWIRSIGGRLIVAELQPRQLAERQDPLLGRFRAVAVSVDDKEAQPTFGELRLLPDGAYMVGGARGRWTWTEGVLTLDGPFAHFGAGVVSGDAHTITFSYARGPMTWKVTYQRVVEPGAPPIAAR